MTVREPISTSGSPRGVALDGSTAYVPCGAHGLDIIDVSFGGRRLDTIEVEGDALWLDVAVAGRFAYVGAGLQGLAVVDLDAASVVSSLDTSDDKNDSAWAVAVSGSTAVLAAGSAGVHAMDLGCYSPDL